MPHITIRRSPLACWLVAIAALPIHFAVCYPAMTCRGYPPIYAFWTGAALFLIFPVALVIPLFDDRTRVVRRPLIFFLVAASLITAMALANLKSGRPHVGHWAGVGALLVQPPLIIDFVVWSAVFLFASHVLRRPWRWCLRAVRTLSIPGDGRPAFQMNLAAFLILLVAPFAGWQAMLGLYHAVDPHRKSVAWYECQMNLKQIGFALHMYHDTYGSFPPAYVVDGNGRPAHSWRVLILPFLGEQEQRLYERYRFDEPWDGPSNAKLLRDIPRVYRCALDRITPRHCASYAVIVGPTTLFPGASSCSIGMCHDGTSNTLLAIEAKGAEIPWTAPVDVPVESLPAMAASRHARALAETSGDHLAGWRVLYADGSPKWHRNETSLEFLQALVTRAGGEAIPWE